MRKVLEMARFELAASLRTKRAIALVAIYLVTSLFGMSGAITVLGKMEEQLANILQVETVEGKSGVVTATLWKSKPFQRLARGVVGDSLVYDDIVGKHPAELIYAWIVFLAVPFLSVLSIPGAAERTIVINSMSKNYVCTGARLAWVIAPVPLIGAMVKEGMNMVFTAPSISQRMAKFALNEGKELMAPIMAEFKERMFRTAERINQIPHLKVQSPPPGTFYLFVNVKETGLTDEEFVLKVLEKAHVALVPGSNFGEQGAGYVRICCTVGLPKLMEAMDRIEALGL